MFDFIRNLFRYKAKSLEDFVQVVRSEGCTSVFVTPYQYAKDGIGSTTLGFLADFQYILDFTSTTPRGRNIVHRKCFNVVYLKRRLSECFGNDPTAANAKDRRNATIKLFLLGEQKVKDLQVELPGVSVNLICTNGRPMDDAMFAKLHQDAADCGVSI